MPMRGRPTAMNGSSTTHSGPSRLDGSCALISGHSFEALQCRQPATFGHRPDPISCSGAAIALARDKVLRYPSRKMTSIRESLTRLL